MREKSTAPAALIDGEDEQPVALDLQDLTWRPATRALPTIDHLDLHIPAGQKVILVGASGCGKSTVLRALAGLLDPSTGDLTGTMPTSDRPGERGMLLQQPTHALVGANVGRDAAFGPENAGEDRPRIQQRVSAALQAAHVGVGAAKIPWAASGGEQQRIALAGSLALGPGAMLLDEPTSMLDAPTAEAVRAAVLDAARGRTLVVADHRFAPWMASMDRVVVLGAQARILADGSPDEVLSARPDLLGTPGAEARPSSMEGSGAGRSVLRLQGVNVRRRRIHGQGTEEHRGAPDLLTGIDLDLDAGGMCALVGPSGSGKTTLLRVALGLDEPASGDIARPDTDRVAYVPQEPEHSFVARTVREEVTASPWAQDAQHAEQLLQRAGLDHLHDAQPYTLSGGEQRRLAVVAALAQQPDLLVLDEPTVGLDRERWQSVVELIDQARASDCAVLVATHDQQLMARTSHVVDLAEHTPDASGGGPDGWAGPDRSVGPDTAVGPEEEADDTTIRPISRTPATPTDALHPLVICLIALLAAVGSFAVNTWQLGVIAVGVALLLAPLTVRSLRGTAVRLFPVALAAAGVCWSTMIASPVPAFTAESWLLGAKEALRITYLVAPGVFVLTSMDPTALGDALGGRLRLPGRPVAASVSGLVRAGLTADVWSRIMTSRRLRGLGVQPTWRHPVRSLVGLVRLLTSCTLALLIDAFRSAEQQALAMDARGFATAQRRSWALPDPFHRADVLGVAVGLFLLALPWVLRIGLG